jgi:hypothetical protein
MGDFPSDERKLGELMLYVAEELRDDPAGGATKLNKVLFFSEFASVRARGRPITGVEYQRLERGPAPRRLLPVRDRLVSTGAAKVRRETYLGFVQHRLVASRKADLSLFEPDEVEIVNQVLNEMRGRSAGEASALSHDELGWQMVEDGETIPYETAYLRRAVPTAKVRQHAEELVAKRAEG